MNPIGMRMNRQALVALLLLTQGLATSVLAVDRVRLIGERAEPGDVVRVTKNGVTLQQAAGSREIPVTAIDSILFNNEPPGLTQGRMNARNGGHATALERLSELRLEEEDRELLKQDLAYYKAYCRAQIALGGGGDPGKAAAALIAFVRSAGDTFHYYEAVETIGRLATAAGRYDQAQKMYATLAKAPFPPLKVRALVLSGQALNASGDHPAAIKRFEQAIRRGGSPDTEGEVFAARLGKAESLAASERIREAVAIVAGVLSGIEDDDPERQAVAYNTLGRCYDAADQQRDALYAYLHTDLLFDRDPDAHAEALARLKELWRVAGKPDAGREAADRLRREYPRTRWARDTGGAG